MDSAKADIADVFGRLALAHTPYFIISSYDRTRMSDVETNPEVNTATEQTTPEAAPAAAETPVRTFPSALIPS